MEYEVVTEKVAISDINGILFNTHIKSFRANRTFMGMNLTLGVKTTVNQIKVSSITIFVLAYSNIIKI